MKNDQEEELKSYKIMQPIVILIYYQERKKLLAQSMIEASFGDFAYGDMYCVCQFCCEAQFPFNQYWVKVSPNRVIIEMKQTYACGRVKNFDLIQKNLVLTIKLI